MDLLVFIGIVIYIVTSVVKAAKSMKAPPSGPTSTTPGLGMPPGPGMAAGPPRARPAVRPAGQPSAGYAGRTSPTGTPEPGRAMTSASPRLTEGAEYAAIVADRESDRAAELRFAQQAKQLIAAETQRSRPPAQVSALQGQTETSPLLKIKIGSLQDDPSALVNAVILAEVLGQPRCKTGPRRLLRM
jgi:hypothetical protein